jgi:hypothetical protein
MYNVSCRRYIRTTVHWHRRNLQTAASVNTVSPSLTQVTIPNASLFKTRWVCSELERGTDSLRTRTLSMNFKRRTKKLLLQNRPKRASHYCGEATGATGNGTRNIFCLWTSVLLSVSPLVSPRGVRGQSRLFPRPFYDKTLCARRLRWHVGERGV